MDSPYVITEKSKFNNLLFCRQLRSINVAATGKSSWPKTIEFLCLFKKIFMQVSSLLTARRPPIEFLTFTSVGSQVMQFSFRWSVLTLWLFSQFSGTSFN